MDYPQEWNNLPKKERRKLKRELYREQLNKQMRLEKLKKFGIFGLISLLIIAGGYWFISQITKPLPGQSVSSLGNKHVKNITDPHDPYNSNPPTSGTHVGEKAPWGISNDPIPDELQLHNLEDGGVMIQYNCPPSPDCRKLIENLSSIVKKYNEWVILAPYPKLDKKIALTAWNRIDKFSEFNADRIERFIKAFKGIDHHQI